MRNKKNTYIIAEVGINHNGSLDNCYKLIQVAAGSGCDCVKFQFFRAKSLYPRTAGRLSWQDAKRKYSYDIYSAVRSFELPSFWVRELKEYCAHKRIDFLSSVLDTEGAGYLISKGMKMIKLPSYTITNLVLIRHCARYRLPIILSTGGATLGEIEEAMETINLFHNNVSLLHCSIKYPTSLNECNLGIIETLKYAFPNNQIGYSDHTQEISKAAVQAVFLGAEIIEKHITLDKNMKGPDHFFSLEPQELEKFVRDIRIAGKRYRSGEFTIDKSIYGNSAKMISNSEKYLRNFAFTNLFAKRDIKKGEIIKVSDISILRPGKKIKGLEPRYLRLFKEYKITAKQDILFEDPITWDTILK